MKTRLMNFRVEEPVYTKIKRAAEAAHETVTDFLLGGAAMRMRALSSQTKIVDPIGDAFDELFKSGKISPLSASERAAVRSYEARKAAGTLKTIPAETIIAELKAQIRRESRLKNKGVRAKH